MRCKRIIIAYITLRWLSKTFEENCIFKAIEKHLPLKIIKYEVDQNFFGCPKNTFYIIVSHVFCN